MDYTTHDQEQIVYMKPRIVIGQDEKGNDITWMDNCDGTWSNLNSEHVFDEAFMRYHFPHFFECTCPQRPDYQGTACPCCRLTIQRLEYEGLTMPTRQPLLVDVDF
jgi:hypothetical protein